MKFSFTKMQGCANDYIYLDCRASGVPENIVPLARKLSARHLHLCPGNAGRRRHHAHLQRRRQRGADVRQRHPLRGRVAACA